jgi:hypothetical protein
MLLGLVEMLALPFCKVDLAATAGFGDAVDNGTRVEVVVVADCGRRRFVSRFQMLTGIDDEETFVGDTNALRSGEPFVPLALAFTSFGGTLRGDEPMRLVGDAVDMRFSAIRRCAATRCARLGFGDTGAIEDATRFDGELNAALR